MSNRHKRLLDQAQKEGYKFIPFKINGAVLIDGKLHKVWGIRDNTLVIDSLPMDQKALNKPQNRLLK